MYDGIGERLFAKMWWGNGMVGLVTSFESTLCRFWGHRHLTDTYLQYDEMRLFNPRFRSATSFLMIWISSNWILTMMRSSHLRGNLFSIITCINCCIFIFSIGNFITLLEEWHQRTLCNISSHVIFKSAGLAPDELHSLASWIDAYDGNDWSTTNDPTLRLLLMQLSYIVSFDKYYIYTYINNLIHMYIFLDRSHVHLTFHKEWKYEHIHTFIKTIY